MLSTYIFSDIVFDKQKEKFELELIQGDILVERKARYKRGAVRPTRMLWPSGIIYYEFSDNFGILFLFYRK